MAQRSDAPLISVIVPVHDAAATLPRCLGALRAQTWERAEFLMVDDASTDGSAALLEDAARRDGRFRVLRSGRNLGVAGARNLALDAMEGSYLAFADADDLVCPQYLERLMEVLAEAKRTDPEIRVAACIALDQPEDGRRTYECRDRAEPRILTLEDYSFSRRESHRVVWGAVYERGAVDGLRFSEKYRCSTDTLFFARLLLRIRKYVHVDERLYCYMLQPASVSKGRYTRRRMDDVLVWEEIRALYRSAPEPARSSAAACPVFSAIRATRQMVREGSRDMALLRELQRHYRFRLGAVWKDPAHRSAGNLLAVLCPALYAALLRRKEGPGK